MSDLQTLFSLRPADTTDEELDKIIAGIRAMRHTFNTTAKPGAAAKPKPPKNETAAAAQKLASEGIFEL